MDTSPPCQPGHGTEGHTKSFLKHPQDVSLNITLSVMNFILMSNLNLSWCSLRLCLLILLLVAWQTARHKAVITSLKNALQISCSCCVVGFKENPKLNKSFYLKTLSQPEASSNNSGYRCELSAFGDRMHRGAEWLVPHLETFHFMS